jgi:hypothetical protein
MAIEILNFSQINKGCLKAKFSINIPEWGGMIIHECLLFAKDGSHGPEEWISLSSKQYKSKKDGSTKTFQLIQLEKGVMQKFQLAVLAKIKSGKIQTKTPNEPNTPF